MDATKHASTHKIVPITKIYLDQNINSAEVENPALPVAFFFNLCKWMSREEGPIFVSPEELLGRSLDLLLWLRWTGAGEFEACRVSLGMGLGP